MADIEFIDGLNAKAPRQNAPGFVKASLSIKREALIAFLQKHDDEWINADIKESKGGKWYVAVDSWKPNSDGGQRQESKPAPTREASYGDAPGGGFDDSDSIPF